MNDDRGDILEALIELLIDLLWGVELGWFWGGLLVVLFVGGISLLIWSYVGG